MKKDIKQLPNIGIEPEKKPNKGKIIIIILTIIAVIAIVLFVLYIIFIYNKPSNKLKRYLSTNEYTCYKKKCVKETKTDKYEIYFTNGNYYVKNKEYTLYIDSTIHIDTKDAYTCTYTTIDDKKLNNINSDLVTDATCRKHIDSVNNYIDVYNDVLNKAKVDVNDLSK